MATNRDGLARNAAARGKYAPLYRHLSAKDGADWRVSFAELEAILGFELPASARLHRPWWSNPKRGAGPSQALAWHAAGWRTRAVDLEEETLVFERAKDLSNRTETPPGRKRFDPDSAMTRMETPDTALEAKQRVETGLEALRNGLGEYVGKHMRDRHGNLWLRYASRARGDEPRGALDIYALLKTLLDNWNDLFSHDAKLRKARSYIHLALDGRNRAAHFTGEMSPREALRYLDAMRELAAAVGAGEQASIIGKLYDEQMAVSGSRGSAQPRLDLEEPAPPLSRSHT